MRGDQKCSCGCHWNWGWLTPAFGETKISVSDIDGVIERCGNFLFIEAKKSDEILSCGQRILLEAISLKPNCTAVVVYGNRDQPEFLEVCHNGKWTKRNTITKEEFFERMARWFEKVNCF